MWRAFKWVVGTGGLLAFGIAWLGHLGYSCTFNRMQAAVSQSNLALVWPQGDPCMSVYGQTCSARAASQPGGGGLAKAIRTWEALGQSFVVYTCN